MPVTFIRTTPFPDCRHCGEPMGYYILGLPDEKHAHPDCRGRAGVDEIMRVFRESLRKYGREASDAQAQ